jgi:hypothetical protein
LRITTHSYLRVALLFAGFVGGFALFVLYKRFAVPSPTLDPLLFFASILGGGFLLQQIFSRVFPAQCPKCGGAAFPRLTHAIVYVCRGCGRESDGGTAYALGAMAAEPGNSPWKKNRPTSAMMWIMLVLGIGAIIGALVFAADSVRLLIKGVTTEARVVKVNVSEHRGADVSHPRRTRRNYRAIIAYRAGDHELTLNRSWSVDQGQSCLAPCYYEGEKLKVRYLPAEPTNAKVYSVLDFFLGPTLFILLGAMCTAVGCIALRRARRPRLEL